MVKYSLTIYPLAMGMKIPEKFKAIGSQRSLIFHLILPIIIFWLALFSFGYPPPFLDDLALTGAAVNLARSGDFFNPLLAAWDERLLDRFYIQPPFHQYVLAAWLYLFGVSTQTLLLFQCLCYITFSIFTGLILKHYGFSKIATALTIISFSFWMLNAGLRQEALGFAFLAIGLWGLTRDTPPRYCWGFFFLGASILTAPTALPYAVLLGGTIARVNSGSVLARSLNYWRARIWAGIAAFVLNALLFLFCIDFKLGLFWQDFTWHSSFRRPPLKNTISDLVLLIQNGYGEIVYGSLIAFYFGLCLWVGIQSKKFSRKLRIALTVLNLSLALSLLLYSRTFITSFGFFCWLGVALIIDEIIAIAPRSRPFAAALVTLVFAMNQSLNLVALAGTHREPPSSYQAVKNYVREHPERRYAIDPIAARFVFDYHLPPKSIDWIFSTRAPLFWPTSVSQKPPGMTWLISPIWASALPELPDYPRVRLWGRTFNTVPSHPYRVIIVE